MTRRNRTGHKIDIGEGFTIGRDVWAFGRAIIDAVREARDKGMAATDGAGHVFDVVAPKLRTLIVDVFDALED